MKIAKKQPWVYAWKPRRIWHRWRDRYYDVKGGIRNLWKYRKVVWDISDADYSSLLSVMEAVSRDIAHHLEVHNITVDAPKRARQLRVVACLCSRLREDDYFHTHFYNAYFHKAKLLSRSRDAYTRDLNYLRHMLRYLPFWWC